MHAQVREKLYELLRTQEGMINFMYLDLSVNPRRGRRLVTVGIGCMIDPMPDYVTRLEWTHKRETGRRATAAEIRQEWTTVSGMQSHCPGQNGWAFQASTTWRLSQGGIDEIFRQKYRDLVRDVPGSCPELNAIDSFPPDAQLAIMVHAWGFGPAPLSGHPGVRRACGTRDWPAAAAAVGWDRVARTRLKELRVMFGNAAAVDDPRYRQAYPRTIVHWPRVLERMAPVRPA
jgi:hypothetical protein